MELKDCPFCGYKARVKTTRDAIGDYQGYVECMDCGATVFGAGDLSEADDAKRDAVGAWNRRAERTCRPEVCDDGAGAWGVYCSECGYRFAGPYGKREVPEHMAMRRDIMPRYCPSCGARAVVE